MFANTYKNKKILVTGHTGFKGSWLSAWLVKLGAEVVGVSKDIPTKPSMFESTSLKDHIKDIQADVRDLGKIQKIVSQVKPDFVFHLAAQAIVSTSYTDPYETISSNVMGTMNILEALRTVKHPCVAVIITSDKAYDNVEWTWGYREHDVLGGKDIYSGSKGAAELVISSYFHSFFKEHHSVRLGIARAGNVIGGGDWASDRIVADCMRSWSKGERVEIRSPKATRPWQHVLEPLSGYLLLGLFLSKQSELHGEAFNFGPRANQNRTVLELLNDLSKRWGSGEATDYYHITDDIPFHEASLLKLNCDKALSLLRWEPNLDYGQNIDLVAEWYKYFYEKCQDVFLYTLEQIGTYEGVGIKNKRVWAIDG
ncbi:MAG: CDP-glucose 4,6-dehydratase [Coxiellaceae bacterium]|nr:CDP-glucose 4,6-dehydratase [Coxiellaceae bacterium]